MAQSIEGAFPNSSMGDLRAVAAEDLRKSGIKVPKGKSCWKIWSTSKTSSQHLQELRRHGMFGRILRYVPVLYDPDYGSIPWFLVDAACIIEQNIEAEGLFRKCGSMSRMKELRDDVNKGKVLLDANVHDVATLLKQFFRDLPEPLIPVMYQDCLVKCIQLKDKEKALTTVLLICLLFPTEHICTLRFTLKLLAKISASANQNKMSARNLAIVMTPNMMHVSNGKLPSEKTLQLQTSVIELLILNADKVGTVSVSLCKRAQNMSPLSSADTCENAEEQLVKKSGTLQGFVDSVTSSITRWRQSSSEDSYEIQDVQEADSKNAILVATATPATPILVRKRKATENNSAFSASKKKAVLQYLPKNTPLPSTPVYRRCQPAEPAEQNHRTPYGRGESSSRKCRRFSVYDTSLRQNKEKTKGFFRRLSTGKTTKRCELIQNPEVGRRLSSPPESPLCAETNADRKRRSISPFKKLMKMKRRNSRESPCDVNLPNDLRIQSPASCAEDKKEHPLSEPNHFKDENVQNITDKEGEICLALFSDFTPLFTAVNICGRYHFRNTCPDLMNIGRRVSRKSVGYCSDVSNQRRSLMVSDEDGRAGSSEVGRIKNDETRESVSREGAGSHESDKRKNDSGENVNFSSSRESLFRSMASGTSPADSDNLSPVIALPQMKSSSNQSIVEIILPPPEEFADKTEKNDSDSDHSETGFSTISGDTVIYVPRTQAITKNISPAPVNTKPPETSWEVTDVGEGNTCRTDKTEKSFSCGSIDSLLSMFSVVSQQSEIRKRSQSIDSGKGSLADDEVYTHPSSKRFCSAEDVSKRLTVPVKRCHSARQPSTHRSFFKIPNLQVMTRTHKLLQRAKVFMSRDLSPTTTDVQLVSKTPAEKPLLCAERPDCANQGVFYSNPRSTPQALLHVDSPRPVFKVRSKSCRHSPIAAGRNRTPNVKQGRQAETYKQMIQASLHVSKPWKDSVKLPITTKLIKPAANVMSNKGICISDDSHTKQDNSEEALHNPDSANSPAVFHQHQDTVDRNVRNVAILTPTPVITYTAQMYSNKKCCLSSSSKENGEKNVLHTPKSDQRRIALKDCNSSSRKEVESPHCKSESLLLSPGIRDYCSPLLALPVNLAQTGL